jgi:tetratricopeptide (TPR) repeat protein
MSKDYCDFQSVRNLLEGGDFQAAISRLNQLEEETHSNPQTRVQWLLLNALCHYFLSDFGMAITSYESALSLSEVRVSAHVCLAYILASCPDPDYRDPDGAVHHAFRACDLTTWQDSRALSTLAAAYARQGRYSVAESTALTARQLAKIPSERDRIIRLLRLIRNREPYTGDVVEDFAKLLQGIGDRRQSEGEEL